ncbi:hypothetical protein ACFFWC_00535 [Plantactinospora siamensis]|uniref:Apolipoprotein N-acyltransferase n=1 Tax=Plantactinospora siamensis TaxID=555372 RepID=A0ABV6NTP2_9ACTN
MQWGGSEARTAARGAAWPMLRRVPVSVAVIGYALCAALAQPLTLAALVAVLLPGVPLAWYGVRRTPRTRIWAGRRTVLTWLGLGVAFCLWELGAFLAGNDDAHPTFSMLADPVLAGYPGRVAGYLLWLGTGAWLVRR